MFVTLIFVFILIFSGRVAQNFQWDGAIYGIYGVHAQTDAICC